MRLGSLPARTAARPMLRSLQRKGGAAARPCRAPPRNPRRSLRPPPGPEPRPGRRAAHRYESGPLSGTAATGPADRRPGLGGGARRPASMRRKPSEFRRRLGRPLRVAIRRLRPMRRSLRAAIRTRRVRLSRTVRRVGLACAVRRVRRRACAPLPSNAAPPPSAGPSGGAATDRGPTGARRWCGRQGRRELASHLALESSAPRPEADLRLHQVSGERAPEAGPGDVQIFAGISHPGRRDDPAIAGAASGEAPPDEARRGRDPALVAAGSLAPGTGHGLLEFAVPRAEVAERQTRCVQGAVLLASVRVQIPASAPAVAAHRRRRRARPQSGERSGAATAPHPQPGKGGERRSMKRRSESGDPSALPPSRTVGYSMPSCSR